MHKLLLAQFKIDKNIWKEANLYSVKWKIGTYQI